MVNETNPSTIKVMDQRPANQQDVSQMLKATAPQHPALNRVHARLVASAETDTVISRYDRMHHRHSRS